MKANFSCVDLQDFVAACLHYRVPENSNDSSSYQPFAFSGGSGTKGNRVISLFYKSHRLLNTSPGLLNTSNRRWNTSRRLLNTSHRRWKASHRRWKQSHRRWKQSRRRWKQSGRRWKTSRTLRELTQFNKSFRAKSHSRVWAF